MNKIRKNITVLFSNYGGRLYAANTAWMIAEQVTRLIAGLFIGIWVARYLGPEDFGRLSFVIVLASILGCFAKLGLDSIVVRELVNDKDSKLLLLGTAFWLKLLAALIIVILIFLFACCYIDDDANWLIFIATIGLIFQSVDAVEYYFQSQVLARLSSICKILQLALSSLVKTALILVEAELSYFVAVTMFDAIMLANSYLFVYFRNNKMNFFPCFDKKIARQLLENSWPLLFSSLVVMIYMRIDQIMIRDMLGDYELGIYSAAVKLSEMTYFLPVVISTSLFPAIIRAKKSNTKVYYEWMQKMFSFMVVLALFQSLLITLAGGYLISTLFGSRYEGAASVLVIHAWASVFVYLTVVSGKYMTAEGKTKKIFYRNLAGMVCNVFLNYIFIPIYYLQGAAYATLISWFVAGYLYDFFDKDQRIMAIKKTKAFVCALR